MVTQLNPTEDYKTSVLSGLSPSIIMECAGRGLAFYTYQTAQEIVYQEYLAKGLAEKYANLSGHMDKIIHDANSEIVQLRDKMGSMQIEQKNLEQKNHELMEAYKDKSRNQQQVQKLYQSLKAQVMASQVASAASDDAENAIHTVASNRFIDRIGNHTSQHRPPPFSTGPLGTNRDRRYDSGHGSGHNSRERVGIDPLNRTYSPRTLQFS
ncbi:MAG: hypothetical protein M1822_003910 [Bathelium mastoideum]|nr:MAG: hypothetical protein M1822_003910 [Bathelium mastoideum]